MKPNLLSVTSSLRASVAACLAAAILFSGCTTLRSVPLPGPQSPGQSAKVKVGDQVQVQLKDGGKLAFRVTALEPDTLCGQDVRVRFADMASLQVRRVDPVRTGGAIVGGAAIVLAVAFLALLASGGFAVMPGGPS